MGFEHRIQSSSHLSGKRDLNMFLQLLFGFLRTLSTAIYMKIDLPPLLHIYGEKKMNETPKHTGIGIASIIFGILGFILYLIGWVFYSFMDNRLYGIIAGLLLGLIAVVLGYYAKKQQDTYGTYGMLLGGLLLIIGLITFILTTPTTVETGYYT